MLEDCSLCPVWALKVHVAETQDKEREVLFISYKDGKKGHCHKNTLSVWIRKLIHHV